MICLHDRKGKQCGSPARFDVFTMPAENTEEFHAGKWLTRVCPVHLASLVWDRNLPAIVVPRHEPPPIPRTPHKRLRRTLRRRASRMVP